MVRLPMFNAGVGARVKSAIFAMPKKAERFYLSPEWKALMKRIKAKRGAFCQRCGAGGRIIGDHIIERRDGGAELDEGNVELLCMGCHNRKTARRKLERVKLRADRGVGKTLGGGGG